MKIYIETLGCPKNFNDSQGVAGLLENEGNIISDNLKEADCIIVNTCGFINDAKVESIDKIFEMSKEGKILVVSGCLSQRYGEELYEEMPEVDIFLGVNDYEKLPKLLKEFKKGKREKHLNIYEKDLDTLDRKTSDNQYSATVKISEGCDNKCAYCVIPSIRGPYRSRRKEDIIEEVKKLAADGVKEIILIAQDTTAYGIDLYGKYNLHELLKEICKIENIKWVRLMYAYEDKITEELIDVMKNEDKICKYIDIPIQHSSDEILKMMKRNSTKKSIYNTIFKLRKAMPDIHIRTTLITGFPGESQEDFDDLLDFVEEMKFERLGVFTYSKEEGTLAATMEGQIEEDIKEERKNTILRSQIEISLENNKKKVGSVLEVLVEGLEEDGSYYGRTKYDAPEIDNEVLFSSDKKLIPGNIVEVKIKDAFDYDLVGEQV